MKHLILILTLVFSPMAFSGTGHSHGDEHSHSHGPAKISKEKSKQIGESQVKRLVKSKKLDASWTFAIYDKSDQKTFKGKREWVVTFTNEKGVKGKKLYIFLSLTGDFVAANFTGK